MANQKLGDVIHFYDKIQVAIVRLTQALSAGDKVKFTRGGEDLFEQEVASMQMEHKEIDKAKPGDEVGIQVDGVVKEGSEVYKAE